MSKGKREEGFKAEASGFKGEGPGEGEEDWLDCEENMGKGSISFADR